MGAARTLNLCIADWGGVAGLRALAVGPMLCVFAKEGFTSRSRTDFILHTSTLRIKHWMILNRHIKH